MENNEWLKDESNEKLKNEWMNEESKDVSLNDDRPCDRMEKKRLKRERSNGRRMRY